MAKGGCQGVRGGEGELGGCEGVSGVVLLVSTRVKTIKRDA